MGNYWLNEEEREKERRAASREEYKVRMEKYMEKHSPIVRLKKENEMLKEQLAKVKKDMEDGFQEAYQMIKTIKDKGIAEKNKLTEEYSRLQAEIKEIYDPEIVYNSHPPKIDPKDIMSDYDIYTKLLKLPGEEAKEIIAAQQLEDLKIQVLMNNPQVMGVVAPESKTYVDVPPSKVEAFIDRMKDQLKKRKVANRDGDNK